jgi:hypothetical protein
MVDKLERLGGYLTFLKAEYGEAQAILGVDLSPAECAVALHQRFHIPIGLSLPRTHSHILRSLAPYIVLLATLTTQWR